MHPNEACPMRLALTALCTTLALTGWWLLPTSAHAIAPDLGDPILNTWIMSWDLHQMASDPLHLFDANMFHPTGQALARTENLFAVAPVFGLFRVLTGNPVLAYNLTLLTGFWLSTWSMAWVVRRWTRTDAPALLAGVAYAFLPLRMFDMPRIQLVWGVWIPLAALAWENLRDRPSLRAGLTLGGLGLLQWTTSIYIFFQAALMLVLFAAIDAVRGLRSAGRPSRAWLAAIAGLTLPALAITALALPYLAQTHRWPHTSQAVIRHYYSAPPSSLLHVTPSHWVWGPLLGHAQLPPGQADPPLFCGLLATVLATAALVLRQPRSGRLAALAVLAALLAMGSHVTLPAGLPSPWELLYHGVPGFSAQRVPWRYGLLLGFAVSALAGLGLDALLSRLSVRARAPLGWIAVLVAALETVAPQPLAPVPPVPPIYAELAARPTGPTLEIPMILSPNPVPYPEAMRLYYSTTHWRPLVNGYPTIEPPPVNDLARYVNAGFTPELERLAAALSLRWIIVHLDEIAPAERALWERLPPYVSVAARQGSDLLLACHPPPLAAGCLAVTVSAPAAVAPDTPVSMGLIFSAVNGGVAFDAQAGNREVTCTWLRADGSVARGETVRARVPSVLLGDDVALEPLRLITPKAPDAYTLCIAVNGIVARTPVRVAEIARPGAVAGMPRLEMELPRSAAPLAPGLPLRLAGSVRNVGAIPLRAGGDFTADETWLLLRWRDETGAVVKLWRMPVPLDLHPNQTWQWSLRGLPPARPGRYTFETALLRLPDVESGWVGTPVEVR